MLVALDNNCPKITQDILAENGHEVVFYARHERDEDWFEEAYCLGAEVFISNDLDIGNLVDRYNDPTVYFVELPKSVGGVKLAEFILDSVNALSQRKSA